MTTSPTIGRVVQYTLSEQDVAAIKKNRFDSADRGNDVREGDVFPAIVVCVWQTSVQLQVFLDGTDTHWAASVSEGEGPRTWAWPPRV